MPRAAYAIEPDASAASYFFAAAAITGGRVVVDGLGRGSLQGDLRFVDILERMGCRVRMTDTGTEVAGPAPGELRGVDVDMADLSDTAQTLAAVAPFASGPTRVTGIGFIRGKETDRVAAVVRELRRAGIDAEEEPDGFLIRPGTPRPARIATYDDHRMAMSFALLGLRAPGIEIEDPACVAKTYPGFFADLDRALAADRGMSEAWRPRYHVTGERNWINDPNGPLHHRGVYHLFFQANPAAPVWGAPHWGHVTSTDLVRWTRAPVALSPEPGGPDAGGCWSGCARVVDGRPALYYTGVDAAGRESVCRAWGSDDLRTWHKDERNPLIPGRPGPTAIPSCGATAPAGTCCWAATGGCSATTRRTRAPGVTAASSSTPRAPSTGWTWARCGSARSCCVPATARRSS